MTDNRSVVASYVTAINAGDWLRLAELFTPDATIQGVTGTAPIAAALAPGSVWHQLHEGLNMRLEVVEMIAEGDRVAVLYIERGRWTGPFLDMGEPTGQSYELVAMEWFELREGRIARRWGARDGGSQARQIAAPPSAAA
ncbi:ester cyclase [Jannaschia formosa]|uniref:ester cyclase n=1 Tax=Jannaschia formosa TaxID=2259592 RepID=UPI000E1C075E|nr:nuclear transport factor 2 family protein [Jannaschia formosa]TFL17565.1 ester cyclase [Jannaschia formosa]